MRCGELVVVSQSVLSKGLFGRCNFDPRADRKLIKSASNLAVSHFHLYGRNARQHFPTASQANTVSVALI